MTTPNKGNLITQLRDLAQKTGDDGESIGDFLTALITSAVHDEQPQHNLKDIYSAVTNSGVVQELDALNVIPLLVNSSDTDARDFISLLSECGNAKEIVIATQESLEHLKHELQLNEDDDEKYKTAFLRLERILVLYTGTIPRLKLRKKTPLDTVQPLFADIGTTLKLSIPSLTKDQGLEVMQRISELVKSVVGWARALEHQNIENKPDIGVAGLCQDVFIESIESLSPMMNFKLAQQKFEEIYPRLVMKRPNSKLPDTTVLTTCVDTANLLSLRPKDLLQTKTIGGLILLAYCLTATPSPDITTPPVILKALLVLLISSLQSNFALDESLYILQTSFHHTPNSPTTLDPDLLTPLIRTLVPLASTHPSPQTRHITFRLLGTSLSHFPPLDKLYMLRDLLLSEESQSLVPMRVAAVGLLKDAVLQALSSEEKNPIASPVLFETLAGRLFKFDASSMSELKELLENGEAKRLVETLSFYYVLSVRDVDNRTGVQDKSNIRAVKSNLVTPLHTSVSRWKDEGVSDHEQQFTLVSLEIALQRVEERLSMLDASGRRD